MVAVTVGWIQGAWTIVAIVGGAFAILNVWDGVAEFRQAEESTDPAYRRFAAAVTLNEFLRLIVQSIFVAIGVASMFLPRFHPVHLPHSIHVFSNVFTWGLLVAAVLTAGQCVAIAYARRAAYHWRGADRP